MKFWIWIDDWLVLKGKYYLCMMFFLANECIAQVNKEADLLFVKYAQLKTDLEGLEQLNFIVLNPDLTAFQKKGILKQRMLNGNVGIFSISDSNMLDYLEMNHIKYAPANNNWKLSAQLEMETLALLRLKSPRKLFILVVKDIVSFVGQMHAYNYKAEIKQVYESTNAIVIKCDAEMLLKEIVPLNAVLFADLYIAPQSEVLLNGYYKTTNMITAAEYFYPQDNGQGITIGIKEKKMDETDIDLQKRVVHSINSTSGNDLHATTIATLAGGAGNSFISGKGLASQCNFFSSSYANLFPDNTSQLLQNKVSVQNHSYGTQLQSFYGAEAMSYDLQTMQNKNLLHVFSCGNSGTDTPSTGLYAGIGGFANLTGNFKMAKNVISIAAIDTSNQIPDYSSSGPLYDGRLAPQLAALGSNGTSESAAIVSGTVAKLQQVYKDLHGQELPPASLIKSILFCTADDIDLAGIDYRSGYGALNVLRAIECLKNNTIDSSALLQGETWVKTISIPPQASNLKIALSWTDTAAQVNSYKALWNDLDLELKEISTGIIYLPWCLNSFPQTDSLKQSATRKRDTLNTAEVITIDVPAAGVYEIKIKASNIFTTSKQDFYIAYTWDSIASFRFVSPLQQSDFYLGNFKSEQIKIKWFSGSVTPLETGALSITVDHGNSWQLLAGSIPLITKQFEWPHQDTSAVIQFRMNTSNGTYYSPEILTSTLISIHTDYFCKDSFRLSWNSQPLAQSYEIYVLGDSAFMIPLVQQTDTFIVLHRNTHPENIYAVQPLLNSVISAARSFAIDITNQGTGCLYRSFYGLPANNTIELTLTLDYLQGLDSIIIEKLSAEGNLLNQVQTIITNDWQLSYTVYDITPRAGENNYRAKIWFGGHFVFSETITIIHTGSQWLFLYPNPHTSGLPVNYVVKEATFDLYLKLFSVEGIPIAEYLINSSGLIFIGDLMAGVYFYQLTNNEHEKLQQGNLIIF